METYIGNHREPAEIMVLVVEGRALVASGWLPRLFSYKDLGVAAPEKLM